MDHWARLREHAAGVPVPRLAAGTAARCATCAGPVATGFARCFHCSSHLRTAGGLLADAVVPVGYAVRGSALAEDLWRYKSCTGSAREAAEAGARLRALLLVFLREHGREVWRAAGMTAPRAVAIVPSGRGRRGEHPLGEMAGCLRLPRVPVAVAPGRSVRCRDLDPGWLRVPGRIGGLDVLLIEDTWVSGASAQSAAVALKLAGATRVATVVLGRHVNPGDRLAAACWPGGWNNTVKSDNGS